MDNMTLPTKAWVQMRRFLHGKEDLPLDVVREELMWQEVTIHAILSPSVGNTTYKVEFPDGTWQMMSNQMHRIEFRDPTK